VGVGRLVARGIAADSGPLQSEAEGWEQVEANLVRGLVAGPLVWLGLADLGWKGAAEGPATAFRLTQGTEFLREYRFHTRRDAHYFCGNCGINTFSTGPSSALGDFHAVVLASLDDLPVEELLGAPVRYLDGRNDEWVKPPAETRHL